jgi:hypothetical protein
VKDLFKPLAPAPVRLLLLLSIGWCEAIVVAIVIPVAILLTLLVMHIMGYTLNCSGPFAIAKVMAGRRFRVAFKSRLTLYRVARYIGHIAVLDRTPA